MTIDEAIRKLKLAKQYANGNGTLPVKVQVPILGESYHITAIGINVDGSRVNVIIKGKDKDETKNNENG